MFYFIGWECGVRGKMDCWLAAFLYSSVRKQAVGVDGRLSTLIPGISVALIGISSSLSLGTIASSFADDTRIQRGIENEEDCDVHWLMK